MPDSHHPHPTGFSLALPLALTWALSLTTGAFSTPVNSVRINLVFLPTPFATASSGTFQLHLLPAEASVGQRNLARNQKIEKCSLPCAPTCLLVLVSCIMLFLRITPPSPVFFKTTVQAGRQTRSLRSHGIQSILMLNVERPCRPVGPGGPEDCSSKKLQEIVRASLKLTQRQRQRQRRRLSRREYSSARRSRESPGQTTCLFCLSKPTSNQRFFVNGSKQK